MNAWIEWCDAGPGAAPRLVVVPGLEATVDTDMLKRPGLLTGVYRYPNTLRQFATDHSMSIPAQIEVFAHTLHALLEDGRETMLIGHCIGGLMITGALARIPERLCGGVKVVLLDTIGDAPQGDFGDWLQGLLDHLRIPESCLRDNARWLQSPAGQSVSIVAVRTEMDSWISRMRPDAFRPQSQQYTVSTNHDALMLAVLQGKAAPFDLNRLLDEARISPKLQ